MAETENVVVVRFTDPSKAYQALSVLKECDAEGRIGLESAAIVERTETGELRIPEGADNVELPGHRERLAARHADRRGLVPPASGEGRPLQPPQCRDHRMIKRGRQRQGREPAGTKAAQEEGNARRRVTAPARRWSRWCPSAFPTDIRRRRSRCGDPLASLR
jgi:hypothetical protein